MAPSRGLSRMCYVATTLRTIRPRYYSILPQVAGDPARRIQVYISRSLNPYLNLSIEHFLLQKTPPESTVLFLYTNAPSVIIGRNQNPWVEVNLGLLRGTEDDFSQHKLGPVSLVRRRSGGGTVFHDEGNVNYSVICPTGAFNRDKHAYMVARALHKLGIKSAIVNDRHDIVLGLGGNTSGEKPLKVSGSAYKLTRLRSLHHGTCLLSSPNIKYISKYLRSPAKPFIKARGVDSVSSPIANVHISNEAFEEAVVDEFCSMYGFAKPMTLSEEAGKIPEISEGLSELKSLDWIFLQTPQFTFSIHKTVDDPRERPQLPSWVSSNVAFSFTVRNGAITQATLKYDKASNIDLKESQRSTNEQLLGQKLHAIEDWKDAFRSPLAEQYGIPRWMNGLFGKDL